MELNWLTDVSSGNSQGPPSGNFPGGPGSTDTSSSTTASTQTDDDDDDTDEPVIINTSNGYFLKGINLIFIFGLIFF